MSARVTTRLPVTFPQRPRLRPFFHIVPLAGGRVQLKSAYRSLVISGNGAPELMRLMFPLLDGTRTPDQIVDACAEHAPDAVQQALCLLQDKAVLEDAAQGEDAALSANEREAFADQLRLFSLFVGDPVRCQAELQAKRAALIGLTPLGIAIARELVRSGIGSVHLMPTSASQARSGMTLADDATAHGSRCLVEVAEPVRDTVEASINSACTGADLVIVPNDGRPEPAVNRIVNEACISLKVPWLPIVLFGNDVAIGPLVVPGQTACLTCYELRMKGNLVFVDEYMAFESYLADGLGRNVSQGGLNVYANVVAGLTVVEAVKYLTKFTYPLAFGRLIRFNFVNYQYVVHPVLRLPRCPACGPTRPTVQEWEL